MLEINKIYNCNCMDGLKLLESNSINICITSPPYFGLRDYGVDGQFGLEQTPNEYVENMVQVFREVKRVLKNEGTLWLNIGDCYAGSMKGYNGNGTWNIREGTKQSTNIGSIGLIPTKAKKIGMKPKDLIGIPWMLAFALRTDGWYLRSDIIWNKPNCMPESVKDRPTKAHEYIFLLSKSPKYYYNNDAIKEIAKYAGDDRGSRTDNRRGTKYNSVSGKTGEFRNKRTIWSINTKPFKGAHFAVFPEELVETPIKAGCPESGIVLDPFMGSGTTAVVAKKLNRNYIGFELNPEYIKIANERINKLTK